MNSCKKIWNMTCLCCFFLAVKYSENFTDSYCSEMYCMYSLFFAVVQFYAVLLYLVQRKQIIPVEQYSQFSTMQRILLFFFKLLTPLGLKKNYKKKICFKIYNFLFGECSLLLFWNLNLEQKELCQRSDYKDTVLAYIVKDYADTRFCVYLRKRKYGKTVFDGSYGAQIDQEKGRKSRETVPLTLPLEITLLFSTNKYQKTFCNQIFKFKIGSSFNFISRNRIL